MPRFFYPLLICAWVLAACSPTSEPHTQNASIDERANAVLSQMTLEEKVGQVIQADIAFVTPEQSKIYNLGSVLNGGNSAPGGGKVAKPEEWIALADAYWDASTDTTDGGVGVPLLWGTDAVHGHNNLAEATIFPHNSALGATHNPDLMRRIGEITAREIRATGLDWTFAPTLAVARDDRWGRAYESYSENPEHIALYASAIVEGLQGHPGDADYLTGENVMATAKHFIGDGGTQYGIDKGNTIGQLDDVLAIHGAGYGPAIKSDIQAIMSSFSSVNGTKLHGSKNLLTGILRKQMGFKGFVVGDWNGHGEVPGCTTTDCPAALEAGIDMYMAPDSWQDLYYSLLAQAKSNQLDRDRLDQAVLNILKAKIRSGLLDAGRPSLRPATNPDVLGAPEHRTIARQAVRESLVLLKNQNNVLPLQAGQKILVTGSGANSMQQQTGGWTLNWQGDNNSNEGFATGETILSGLTSAISDIGGQVVHSPDGSYDNQPDIAVVVYGEHPYAEFRGDRGHLVYEFEDGEHLDLLRQYQDAKIPVVSVFLTGRPLWVNPHLNASDAFVVAWLPGTEAGGVADVLTAEKSGQPSHDFTGKLSFSWPSDGTGTPINEKDDPAALYSYGYGLTYGSAEEWTDLPETPGTEDLTKAFDGTLFSQGDPNAVFTLSLKDALTDHAPANPMISQSLGGGISTSGIDYKAQEDARLFVWSGSTQAQLELNPRQPIDLSRLGEIDKLNLSLEWRINETSPITLSLSCTDGCDTSVELFKLSSGDWSVQNIPLRCFANGDWLSEKSLTGLKLSAATKTQIAIHTISIRPLDTISASCPNR